MSMPKASSKKLSKLSSKQKIKTPQPEPSVNPRVEESQPPEVETEGCDFSTDDFIEAPSVPVRLPVEVQAGMNDPSVFNQAQAQAPGSLPSNAKARALMSLPEIPSMRLPDAPRPKIALAGKVVQESVPVSAPASAPTQFQRLQNPPQQFPWKGKDLFIAMPCYKFTNPATMWVAVQLALDLGRDLAYYDMEMGDAMIYHARNKLADRFLKSNYTWMFFLDDDIIPPTGRATWMQWVGNLPEKPWTNEVCGRHVLTRLMGHGKSLVGGTYFGRQVTGVPVSSAAWNPQEENLARTMMNMVRPVDWMGTGCMLIHRQVFLDIQVKFPHLAPSGQRKWWDFFLPTEHGGEDVSFCARARAAGHQPWLDMGVQCLHVGWNAFGAHNTGQKARVVVG